MQPSSTTIEFTEAERAAFEERQRKLQATLLQMAESSREESDRLGDEFFHELRAARRVQTARRMAPAPPVQRMPGHSLAAPRERREAASSRSSGQDPGGDVDPEQDDDGPWALTRVDRAPLLWRLRALRCRLLEIREGVER